MYAQGGGVGYDLYKTYNASVRAAHFTFIPFDPPTPQDIADNNITLSNIAQVTLERGVEWSTTGNSYFEEQTFKVIFFFIVHFKQRCYN